MLQLNSFIDETEKSTQDQVIAIRKPLQEYLNKLEMHVKHEDKILEEANNVNDILDKDAQAKWKKKYKLLEMEYESNGQLLRGSERHLNRLLEKP